MSVLFRVQIWVAHTIDTMLNLAAVQQAQRDFFASHATKDVAFRQAQLRALYAAVKKREAKLLAALYADLHKGNVEGYFSEVGFVLNECSHALANITRWARPNMVRPALVQLPATCWVYPEPLGMALIIAPYNYPLQLLLAPLIGALAAGDTAVLKPSEYTPHVAQAIEDMVRETFDPAVVTVVQGDAEVSKQLLALPWDFIFFTGSTSVGRVVAQAAAQHLTPCLLELGGKSPAIVTADADIVSTAKRIAWGKWINAGQTCVAPDYVLVDRRIAQSLLNELSNTVRRFYGEDAQQSVDYGRIVNARHFQRLAALMASGRVVQGGQMDVATRYIAPTILTDVALDSPIMQDEIFGPLLPVIAYDTLDEALAWVNARPTPLSLYVFSQNKQLQARVLRETQSGNACVNDCTVQFGSPYLPFGGVGASGLGRYHGKATFEAFSHPRSVLKRWNFDVWFRWLPYGRVAERMFRLLLR